MTPTSEERREVAARLRQMADAHDATEASRVARALELEYKVYGTVVAFDSADIRKLAELIDPTCKIDSVEPIEYGEFNQTIGYDFNLTCGHSVMRPYMDMPPAYCDECGARVVSDDG